MGHGFHSYVSHNQRVAVVIRWESHGFYHSMVWDGHQSIVIVGLILRVKIPMGQMTRKIM
jgi:hypothetical protein